MLPFIVFVRVTIINSTEAKFEVIKKRGTLAKNSDGRQTNSEVKPCRAGLVLGWVTTFKHKLFCWSLFL